MIIRTQAYRVQRDKHAFKDPARSISFAQKLEIKRLNTKYVSCFITGLGGNDSGPALGSAARRNNLNAKIPVGAGCGFLLGGGNVSTSWHRLEAVIKIELWLATGDVAQDLEEVVASEPP